MTAGVLDRGKGTPAQRDLHKVPESDPDWTTCVDLQHGLFLVSCARKSAASSEVLDHIVGKGTDAP